LGTLQINGFVELFGMKRLNMKYFITYPIFTDCQIRCPYCFHKKDFDNKNKCGPSFTVDEYLVWRDSNIVEDAEDIVLQFHAGEISTDYNTNYLVSKVLSKLDIEKTYILTNGLGSLDNYKKLLDNIKNLKTFGFTYHREILDKNPSLKDRFYENIEYFKNNNIPMYVKELLILKYKEDILKHKSIMENKGFTFKIQDFKGYKLGEDFEDFKKYTKEDIDLISPEYIHSGCFCECLKGYKNVIIRGGWNSGDIIACWIDPCVIGSITENTYYKDFMIFLNKNKKILEVMLEDGEKIYKGNYYRDRNE